MSKESAASLATRLIFLFTVSLSIVVSIFNFFSFIFYLPIMPHIKEIIDLLPKLDHKGRELITKAYHFAETAHEGQSRKSGEPYFNHVFATGKNLANLGMSPTIVAAGLLHDTIEDTATTARDIEREFGKDILGLVESVTKLGTIKYKGIERNVENLRKFFVSLARDMRVIIIKLCDRLHNVETLEFVRPDKQRRIALETLEIYAPLAHRLGMGKLKGALEDAAFPFAYPKEYKQVTELLREKTEAEEKYLAEVEKQLRKLLKQHGMEGEIIDHRVKHLYSLFKKLRRHDMDIDKIYDIIALRVIVDTVEQCYHILGVIHGVWKPLPGRIKDYIASPKPNGYQSLHTIIFTGTGGIVEIQIRTKEMHEQAEYGIAAHFAYKEHGSKKKIERHLENHYAWLQQIRDAQKNEKDVDKFFENLKMDFFGDRVFIFTPKGDIIDLPDGSSALDFAYAVHSDIGTHASGAKVNGKFVSMSARLATGDIVEVETKRNIHPTSKWLDHAKTALARNRIARYLKFHPEFPERML